MSSIWMKPIDTPNAWQGATLATQTSWILTLTEAEIADVDRAVATAKATGRPLEEIQREHFPLMVLQPRLAQVLAYVLGLRSIVCEHAVEDDHAGARLDKFRVHRVKGTLG